MIHETMTHHPSPITLVPAAILRSAIAFGVEVRSVSYADQVPTGGRARERARDVA
jgi:hypothetical protein